MGWQDYIVCVVGVAVAAVILRRLVCFFRGRKRGVCASCASTVCPLKQHAKKR